MSSGYVHEIDVWVSRHWCKAGQELRANKEGIYNRMGCGLVGDKAHVHIGGGGKNTTGRREAGRRRVSSGPYTQREGRFFSRGSGKQEGGDQKR